MDKPNKIQIAFNASALISNPSGVGEFTLQLLQQMISLCEKKEIKNYVFISEKYAYLCDDFEFSHVMEIPDFSNKALKRILWNQLSYPNQLKQLQKTNSNKSKDIKLISYAFSSHGYASLGGLFNLSNINIEQNIVIHDLISLAHPKQHPLQTRYFKYILKDIINNCEQIFTISNHSKKDIQEHYKTPTSKISVIPNGIDHQCYQGTTKNHKLNFSDINLVKRYFVLPGATYPHKNAEIIIRALAQLRAKHHDDTIPHHQAIKSFRLYITGSDSPYIGHLKRLCQELELEDIVLFLGYINKNDLAHLYSKAKFMIYPSLYEGFGMPPIEAMACGCPTVVSNTTSLPEVCGTASFYIQPKNIEQIKLALKVMMLSLDDSSYVSKGIEHAQKYTWQSSAQKTLEKLLKI